MYPNLIKAIYDNHTSILFNGERFKAFPLKIKKKTKVSSLLFSVIPEVLDRAIRQEINHSRWKGICKIFFVCR